MMTHWHVPLKLRKLANLLLQNMTSQIYVTTSGPGFKTAMSPFSPSLSAISCKGMFSPC